LNVNDCEDLHMFAYLCSGHSTINKTSEKADERLNQMTF
jgi:hypothetical protein